MITDPHPYKSTYTVRATSRGFYLPQIKFFVTCINTARVQSLLAPILRYRPSLPAKNWAGLTLWALLLTIGLTGFQKHTLPVVPADVAKADGEIATTQQVKQHSLSLASKVTVLPGGPTDQLLPPGQLAPIYSYKNNYSAGQCTWYVAGRKPVPGDWGNANTWFYHARALGWATGTTPAIAAIAWTPAGPYGHVALVEDVDVQEQKVLISEMNYRGPYQFDRRWVSISTFKYIY